MISRAIVLASATSVPTLSPSHMSAHAADVVRRGSTTYSFAPFWIPFSRWWNQIGCASRAFDPQRKTKSVCSASSYELVEPPAPRIVVRPTTEGACQVRLQLSMLLLPNTCRANFDARKLTSLVDFEQLKMPVAVRPFWPRLRRNPSAARSRASSQVAGRSRAVVADQRLREAGIGARGVEAGLHVHLQCGDDVRRMHSGAWPGKWL